MRVASEERQAVTSADTDADNVGQTTRRDERCIYLRAATGRDFLTSPRSCSRKTAFDYLQQDDVLSEPSNQ